MDREAKKERFKNSLLELAKSGKFIPGIYNYCDRWCERCTMTAKCLNFAHGRATDENAGDSEPNDISNEKFWENIHLSFQVTLELLLEEARRRGIDLEKLPDVERKKPEKKPVEKIAGQYSKKMWKWLKDNRESLEQKAQELLVVDGNTENSLKFADAWEVVQWYGFFISAKVHRAHFELDERQEDKYDEYSAYSDNLGSAKIALIAIDRSMAALSVMYALMPAGEDEFLDFLSLLSKIRKMMLETFPDAMAFKRPGFDD